MMQNERIGGRTIPLYEKNGELFEFEATVLECTRIENYYEVILDATAFFPQGGGQYGDTGYLDDCRVIDTYQRNGDIIHKVEKAIAAESKVIGRIDAEDRLSRMRVHIAEHLLCGIIHQKYGFDNTGFHIDKDNVVTMDVSGGVGDALLQEALFLANCAVLENKKIYPIFPGAEELEQYDYRSKLEIEDGVRLVCVDDYDLCACCAPCLSYTGQIGPIRIIDSFPHRGGTRIILIAGKDAITDYNKLDESNSNIMKALSCKRNDSDVALRQYMERVSGEADVIKSLKETITGFYNERLVKELEDNRDKTVIYFYTEGLDEVQIRKLLNNASVIHQGITGIINNSNDRKTYIFISSDESEYPLRVFAKRFNEANNSRGGGSDKMIQGSFTDCCCDISEVCWGFE